MIPWRDAFPEFKGNETGTLLSGYLHREGLTQMQLAEATGIPQRHSSEMENGKRIIGVVSAKKLAAVLHCDHRSLL
jgi:transcriptional regulator with XRE-family HTH domain